MPIPEGAIPLITFTREERLKLIKPYGSTVYTPDASTYQVMTPDGKVRDPLDPKGGRKIPLKRIFIKP